MPDVTKSAENGESMAETRSEKDYSDRADFLADKMRDYLVLVNTGAVALVFSTVAAFHEKEADFSLMQVFVPVGFFVFGLVVTGMSLLYAKHKALIRRDCAKDEKTPSDFKKWYQRNESFEIFSFVMFILGTLSAILLQL
jgi:hypothetical protein